MDTVEHSIMLKQESSGTQTAYLMLSRLLPVFTYGGEAVIDELEADLDPEMLVPILDFFSLLKQTHIILRSSLHAIQMRF